MTDKLFGSQANILTMFLCKQLNQKHLERILLLNGYAYTRQSQLTAWLVRAVSEK